MKFTEEQAKLIIEKYTLSPKTLKVWKTRGSIPDRYFQEDYEKPAKLNRKEKREKERIIKILESKKINKTYLAELSGVHRQMIQDAMKGKRSFSRQDHLAIKKAINRIRVDVKEIVMKYQNRKDYFREKENRELKDFLRQPDFFWNHFLDTSREEYGKIIDWKLGKYSDIDFYLKKKIIDQAAIFLLESGI